MQSLSLSLSVCPSSSLLPCPSRSPSLLGKRKARTGGGQGWGGEADVCGGILETDLKSRSAGSPGQGC